MSGVARSMAASTLAPHTRACNFGGQDTEMLRDARAEPGDLRGSIVDSRRRHGHPVEHAVDELRVPENPLVIRPALSSARDRGTVVSCRGRYAKPLSFNSAHSAQRP